MVTRICKECGEGFHPYTKDDFVCDNCIDDLTTFECSVCGFFFKPVDKESVCKDCLGDNLEKTEVE